MKVRLQWPFGGLSDDASFTDQPQGTTRDLKNVRNIDPTTGRRRGAQRSGQTKFNSTAVSSSKIQHMVSVTDPSPGISLQLLDEPDIAWDTEPLDVRVLDVAVDSAGDVYTVEAPDTVVVRNSSGSELYRFQVALPASSGNPGETEVIAIALDEGANVYLISAEATNFVTDTTTPADGSAWAESGETQVGGSGAYEADTRVFRYRRISTFDAVGFAYELDWAIQPDTVLNNATAIYIPSDLYYQAGVLYVVMGGTTDSSPWDTAVYAYGNLTGIIPSLIHVKGPDSGSGPLEWSTGGGRIAPKANSSAYWVTHWDPDSAANTWLCKRDRSDNSVVVNVNGQDVLSGPASVQLGIAIAYNDEFDYVHVLGRHQNGNLWVLTFDEDGVLVWDEEIAAAPYLQPGGIGVGPIVEQRVHMRVDSNGNLFVPIYTQFAANSDVSAMHVYDGLDGALLQEYTPSEHINIGTQPYLSVAFPPNDPLLDASGAKNLLDDASDYTQSTWTLTNCTTGAGVSGPFGNATVSLTNTSGGTSTCVQQEPSATMETSTYVVYSVWAKMSSTGADPYIEIQRDSLTTRLSWTWNSSTGAAQSLTQGGGGLITESGIAETTFDGWYRVYFTAPLSQFLPLAQQYSIKLSPSSSAGETTYFANAQIESKVTKKPGVFSNVPFPFREVYLVGGTGQYYTDLTDEEKAFFTSVRKVRVVDTKVDTDSARDVITLVVSEGGIDSVTEDTITEVVLDSSITQALSPSSLYISSTVAFQNVFFTDGGDYRYLNLVEGKLKKYVAESSGEIPVGGRLMATWGGRVVIARFSEASDNWAMSAIGKPFDWNFFPDRRTPSAAVAAVSATHAGNVGDAINSICPINDDLLLFFCDHSIYRLTGNPANRGQIDLVSDITGGCFGKCWAKDPSGNVFFMGSRGRLYVIPAGGAIPQPLTENTIDERLESVDLSTYRFELVYNYKDRGVHIVQIPYGDHTAVVKSWFYDVKHNAIFEDEINSTTKQPTALMILDGDAPSDRVLLLGCQDGYIRKWDEDALTDDGTNIDSYALIGPAAAPDGDKVMRFRYPQAVFAAEQSGVNFELFAENEPDTLSTPVARGLFSPGRNRKKPLKARGRYFYMRLRDSSGQRWALESIHGDMFPAGRVRASG